MCVSGGATYYETGMESNATLILTTVMLCKGLCSFMHCAYEMIEDLCSVAKPHGGKVVLFKKKKKKKKTLAKISWYWGP